MLNDVKLQGRLTADPELRKTTTGTSVASFTIAVDRDYQSGEANTDFINIVAWRGTAEFVSKYFKKGKMILVGGSIQVRSYTTKNGEKRYATEVVADKVWFCGDRNKTASTGEFDGYTGGNAAATNSFEEVEDEELPF